MSIKAIGADNFLLDVRIYKDGRQLRQRETFHGNRKKAELRYWDLKREMQAGADKGIRSFSTSITTFKHIIDYYLARSNIDRYSKTYLNKLKEDLGNVEISEMRDRFDRYLLLLRKTKVRNTGKVLTNSTINRYIAWAKAAFNCALRAGITDKNPLQHFQKLPTRPRDRLLTEDERQRLIEVVKNEAPHIYPIVLFSLLIPCRAGELRLLKRTDYNMVTNTIHVPAEITKMKRPCIKPVPDCLTDYFRNIPAECPYLFYRHERGRYLSIGNFRGTWKKCLTLAAIEDYKFHDQRRGAYTSLLLAGNLPHAVMQVSGHATDMSKVYFGRNEMNAAKSINFKEIGTLIGTLGNSDATQAAIN